MLTPAETALLTWLVEFQQRGSNQITLARKDIAVIVNLLKRNDVAPSEALVSTAPTVTEVNAPTSPTVTAIRRVSPLPRVCIDCGKPFTDADPMRCAVVGKGPLHGACADKRGLTNWRLRS